MSGDLAITFSTLTQMAVPTIDSINAFSISCNETLLQCFKNSYCIVGGFSRGDFPDKK